MYKPMKSFYEQLHAYVRRKLYEVYGEEVRFKIGKIMKSDPLLFSKLFDYTIHPTQEVFVRYKTNTT